MTYSIIGLDRDSGEIGVATQSQAFAVGGSVPFALPGHGVIATQSMAEPMYGSIGLDLLRGGLSAQESLTALRSVDPHPDRRQVAIADVSGGLAVYTGQRCVAAAGHVVAEDCMALANMVDSAAVWEAMASSFSASTGPLVHRLLRALHSAEQEGGDFRGRRSAAVLVVRAVPTGRPWHDTVVDLRVDDARDPVGELDGLVLKQARYQVVVRSFERALDGDAVAADRELAQLQPLDRHTEPDQVMWTAVVAALAGRQEHARGLIAELRSSAPEFVEAVRRFGAAGLVPAPLAERLLET